MTPAETDLARRLVDHPRWRWMAGIMTDDGARVLLCDDNVRERAFPSVDTPSSMALQNRRVDACGTVGDRIPDITDPATCGCLLAMLWDESPNANLARRAVAGHAGPDSPIPKEYRSPGAALASALLAAWEAKP
jgi:hypothetical protein